MLSTPRSLRKAQYRRHKLADCRFVLSACLILFLVDTAVADTESDPETSVFSYGIKGLQYESADGNNFLWFGVRLQARYSSSWIDHDDAPGTPDETSTEARLNRGRLKLGGHLITPRLQVYSEYDFTKSNLLDLRVTYEFAEWLNIRVGQWKSDYNRERIDSSGAQQFVERSIATQWFTIDRQKGIVASGRLRAGTALDSSYWFGRVSGAGRGGDLDDAEGLWMARYQWNFTKRVLAFSQSDIGRRDKPAGSIALAAVSGESMYTQFSGAGGGQLPGYVNGESDQYQIDQALFETAWQYKGFSWQQELHWKTVMDTVANTETEYVGGYMQAGMFFSEIWEWMPEPLEFALRYASVEADGGENDGTERDSLIAANWFFHGHRNKLTADISRNVRKYATDTETETRFRFQWDVSF
jgi:phosphate-selective porin OprO/OprP